MSQTYISAISIIFLIIEEWVFGRDIDPKLLWSALFID